MRASLRAWEEQPLYMYMSYMTLFCMIDKSTHTGSPVNKWYLILKKLWHVYGKTSLLTPSYVIKSELYMLETKLFYYRYNVKIDIILLRIESSASGVQYSLFLIASHLILLLYIYLYWSRSVCSYSKPLKTTTQCGQPAFLQNPYVLLEMFCKKGFCIWVNCSL